MANLKEQLHIDLTAAIKAKDSLTSGTLRMVLAAITNEEVSGKEARVLNDKERAELEIIQAYLPAALSDEDLAKIISSAVAEVAASGSTGPSAMGAVMKLVSPQVSGRADGSTVAAAVKSALA